VVVEDFVTHYIVERKTMNDLALSIIDGRYQEQKLRLGECGLRKRIYLIEGKWSSGSDAVPTERLRTAMHFTQAEGFLVQHCKTADASIAFLAALHRQVASLLPGGGGGHARHGERGGWLPEPRQTYAAFTAGAAKNREATVGSVFGKQLRMVNGVSATKAEALLRQFPVPRSLVEACDAMDTDAARAKMLAKLKWGSDQKNLGPALAGRIGALVSKKKYG